MGVQIVHHQYYLRCIGVLLIQKPLDLFGPILASPVFLCISEALAIERLSEHKDAGSSIPNVLIIFVLDPPVLGSKAFSGIGEKLNRLLIHANHREVFIIWAGIDR